MPKAAIKPSAISPLWALLALRSVRAIQGNLLSSCRPDAWGIMPGLRLAHPDPDRSPARWTETWHEAVRQRHALVESHPLLAIPSPVSRAPDPAEMAAAFARGQEPVGVVWDAPPTPEAYSPAATAMGWRLPVPPPPSGWPPKVLERLLSPRPAGQQVWLVVPPGPDGLAWCSDGRFKDSLRWGASWWFTAPTSSSCPAWDAYSRAMVACARRLLCTPEAEQWVWPVADLIQQAMEEVMRTGGLSSRSGAPWGGNHSDEWASLRRSLWGVAQDSFGGRGALEDATAGIVFSALKKGWLPVAPVAA